MTEDFNRLIVSAQSALADVTAASDYRAKKVLIKAARVQAKCAEAVAIHQLARVLTELLKENE